MEIRERLMKNRGLVSSLLPPAIHKEGWAFVIICFVTTVLLGLLWGGFLVIGSIVTLLCYYFFRDPDRITLGHEGLVIAPADGVIQSVEEVLAPQGIGHDNQTMKRVAIFMSPLNVHVNRIPIDGKIIGLKYRPGKFLNASLDKSSDYNERQAIGIETKDSQTVVLTQIAGFVARRIVCDLSVGEEVVVGNRFGIIRFGSRVDVYVPTSARVCVAVGQHTIGGETTLALLEGHGI